MDKIGMAITVVGVLALASGCTMLANSMPQGGVPLEDLKTTATYDVLGPAVGTSTGGYILGLIPVGVERKSGAIATGVPTFHNPIQRAAIYNAIESVPDADAILAPRWNSVHKWYLVYTRHTVTVKGKAVRYNTSTQ